MNLSIGIVGLPNVGKSTLFNALLKKQQALVANYPFATIEPNVGVVGVPDERLSKLAEIIGNDPPIKPAVVNFVDIAGLVKGASEGAGLGNKFLSHIREVSVVAHVVRAFEDPDVLREGSVGPKEDYETINTELILSDLQSVQKVLENRKTDPSKKNALEKLQKALNDGERAYDIEENKEVNDLFLLTSKPEILVLNVSEEKYNPSGIEEAVVQYINILGIPKDKVVVICAKIEAELASLSEEEQKDYLFELGLEESGLERLIKKAYQELGLISFLTAGEKEVRAWTIKKGSTALEAAGEIHTDFMKKFIKAEVVPYSDFVENNGCKGSREKGKARLEGKDYVMQDGDVVEFKIGS
jgi:ribosome-binding ATPase